MYIIIYIYIHRHIHIHIHANMGIQIGILIGRFYVLLRGCCNPKSTTGKFVTRRGKFNNSSRLPSHFPPRIWAVVSSPVDLGLGWFRYI